MKAKYLILAAAIIAFAVSCKDKPDVDGCICNDHLFFANDFKLVLEAQAQDTIIKTDYGFWWELIHVYDDQGGNGPSLQSPDKFEYEWITVERVDIYSLKLSIKENTTGKQREMNLSFSNVLCYETFPITQKAAATE